MSIEDTIKVLANEQRRNILYHLEESDGEMTYDEIHETLVEEEVIPEEDPSFQLRLHHAYLPMMEDEGLIKYDEEREEVVYVENEQVGDLLNALRNYSD